MLEEVEQSQVATFVPHAYLRTFFVFVATDDVPLEEVIPAIASLERARIEELNLLLLNREKEVLPWLDQDHVDVVIWLETENRPSFRLLEYAAREHIDLTVFLEKEAFGQGEANYPQGRLLHSPIDMAQSIEFDTVEDNISIWEGRYELDGRGFVIGLEQLEIGQVARRLLPAIVLLLHEVELDESPTVSVSDQELFVDDHLRRAIAMHFEFADLLLVLDIPDPVLGVDTCTDYVAVINDLDFIDYSMWLHVDFQNLIRFCVE